MRGRDIKRIVEEYYGVSLNKKSMKRQFVRPRQVAQYLIRQRTKLSAVSTGRLFRNIDHTTILSNVKKIEELKINCPETSADLQDIEAIIENKLKNMQNNPCVIINNKL
jgi:chromosomal replication initiation ATPase DnaA